MMRSVCLYFAWAACLAARNDSHICLPARKLHTLLSLLNYSRITHRTMSGKVVDNLILPDDSIIAAPCTPITKDGDVDVSKFESYAAHMVSTGITGLFANGTLGEGMSLSVDQRMRSLEKWLQVAKDKFNVVIVHCGALAISDVKALCAHAEKCGVNAVAVMCPTLFKPSSIPELVMYLKEVAACCPNTPFMYYDINVVTGVMFATAEVMRQCKTAIPNFSGIKFSCRELCNYEAALDESENGRYKLALGTVDEEFLPWLPLGARIPICHSMMGSIHTKTRESYLSGDAEAARLSQLKANKIGFVKEKYGSDMTVTKAILKMMGQDLGPVLPPLFELSSEKYDALEKDLREIGFFQ